MLEQARALLKLIWRYMKGYVVLNSFTPIFTIPVCTTPDLFSDVKTWNNSEPLMQVLDQINHSRKARSGCRVKGSIACRNVIGHSKKLKTGLHILIDRIHLDWDSLAHYCSMFAMQSIRVQ